MPVYLEVTTSNRLLNLTTGGIEIWTSFEAPSAYGGEMAYKVISTATIQPADKQSVEKVILFREF